MLVRVYIVQKRKIHEAEIKWRDVTEIKGLLSPRIMPEEDMPFLPDGTPVGYHVEPIRVPSRMNIGQVLELHFRYGYRHLGIHVATPVFDGATDEDVFWETVREVGMASDGKTKFLRWTYRWNLSI